MKFINFSGRSKEFVINYLKIHNIQPMIKGSGWDIETFVNHCYERYPQNLGIAVDNDITEYNGYCDYQWYIDNDYTEILIKESMYNEYEALNKSGQSVSSKFEKLISPFIDSLSKQYKLNEIHCVLQDELSLVISELKLKNSIEKKRNERRKSY